MEVYNTGVHTNRAKPGLKIANDESLQGLPKYERLRNYIVSELHAGRLRPGDALPTEHELAERASMSRITARLALAQLEHNGVIRRVRGRGTFIHEAAMERLQSGLDIFALVIPQTWQGYYPSLQRGFHEASAACRNQVIVCDTGNDPFRQADAFLQLLDKDVAGIALVPTTSPTTPAHQVRALRRRGIPVVFCHRPVEGAAAPLVTFSGLEVGRVAGTALLAHGHRRAAFLGSQRIGLSAQYEQGLREALEQGGGELPEPFVRYGDTTTIDAAHERFLESNLSAFLQSSNRPTAVFCTFDSEAEAVYLLLQRMGVRVPEEISLVGFGGTWRDGAIIRRLTSVAVDEEEVGRQAVRLLNEMRRRERPLEDATEITLPLSLSAGQTLGPAPRLIS